MPGGRTPAAVQARGALPRLRWAAPAAAVYVALVALLMAVNLLRIGHRPSLTDVAWLGVAALVAAWGLELVGLPWPRVVLALLTAVIVGYLVKTFDNGLAPLLLLLAVVWVAYTRNRRDSYVALGLGLATLVPFWAQFDISVRWTIGIVSMWATVRALIAQQRTRRATRRPGRAGAAGRRGRTTADREVSCPSAPAVLAPLPTARMPCAGS